MPKGGKMNKILMYSIGATGLAVAGLVVIPGFAQAQTTNSNVMGNGAGYGNQQVMQTKAKTLGITEDELRTQLQTKTMLQIAEEKGISEDQFHATMQTAAQERWKADGLTQAEIDARLKDMTERQAGDHTANSANRGGMGMRYNHSTE